MSGKALAAGADRMHNPQLAPCGSLNNTSLSLGRAEYIMGKQVVPGCPPRVGSSALTRYSDNTEGHETVDGAELPVYEKRLNRDAFIFTDPTGFYVRDLWERHSFNGEP